MPTKKLVLRTTPPLDALWTWGMFLGHQHTIMAGLCDCQWQINGHLKGEHLRIGSFFPLTTFPLTTFPLTTDSPLISKSLQRITHSPRASGQAQFKGWTKVWETECNWQMSRGSLLQLRFCMVTLSLFLYANLSDSILALR